MMEMTALSIPAKPELALICPSFSVAKITSQSEFSNQAFSARHHQPDCNDSDSCTIDTFDGKACVHTPKDCDDKNATTFDYCYEGNCVHILTSCDDGNACTTDSYNGTDCVHTSTHCDDKIPAPSIPVIQSRGASMSRIVMTARAAQSTIVTAMVIVSISR